MQAADHRCIRPRRLRQQPLQGPGRGTVDAFGHILRVAPVRLLHQQSPHILLAAILRLMPPEERRKLRMEGRKRPRYLLKCSPVYLFIPPTEGGCPEPSL